MNKRQQMALSNPCPLGFECMHPMFHQYVGSLYKIGLTVDNGHD
jgi:hypothetical protein